MYIVTHPAAIFLFFKIYCYTWHGDWAS